MDLPYVFNLPIPILDRLSDVELGRLSRASPALRDELAEELKKRYEGYFLRMSTIANLPVYSYITYTLDPNTDTFTPIGNLAIIQGYFGEEYETEENANLPYWVDTYLYAHEDAIQFANDNHLVLHTAGLSLPDGVFDDLQAVNKLLFYNDTVTLEIYDPTKRYPKRHFDGVDAEIISISKNGRVIPLVKNYEKLFRWSFLIDVPVYRAYYRYDVQGEPDRYYPINGLKANA